MLHKYMNLNFIYISGSRKLMKLKLIGDADTKRVKNWLSTIHYRKIPQLCEKLLTFICIESFVRRINKQQRNFQESLAFIATIKNFWYVHVPLTFICNFVLK